MSRSNKLSNGRALSVSSPYKVAKNIRRIISGVRLFGNFSVSRRNFMGSTNSREVENAIFRAASVKSSSVKMDKQ